MKNKLAIYGGDPVRSTPFPIYNTLGEEERAAVNAVFDKGVLSKFLGTWSPDFYGGECVQRLERAWESYFDIPYAISVNSATSGLYAAVGAAGVGPGDEVIVSPYTMTASAAAAIVYGAIPIFADIDPDTFCITAKSIRERLTPYTKAIIVVDIFGRPAEFDEIMNLANEHNLIVIEDCAQAPGAKYKNRYAGTLAHMGVFSLNYHKTIHCGEGGVVVTHSKDFAERLQLIRNHGEVVVKNKGVTNLVNMVGFNYRMTEIEAAIAFEQLKKLSTLVYSRQDNANYLQDCLVNIPEIEVPALPDYIEHGYYIFPIKLNLEKLGGARDTFVSALRAEGIPVGAGYVEPIYLQPMYQEKIAFGDKGFPFKGSHYLGSVDYSKGVCPIAESMHFSDLITGDWVHSAMTKNDLDDIVFAIKKVIVGLSS